MCILFEAPDEGEARHALLAWGVIEPEQVLRRDRKPRPRVCYRIRYDPERGTP